MDTEFSPARCKAYGLRYLSPYFFVSVQNNICMIILLFLLIETMALIFSRETIVKIRSMFVCFWSQYTSICIRDKVSDKIVREILTIHSDL